MPVIFAMLNNDGKHSMAPTAFLKNLGTIIQCSIFGKISHFVSKRQTSQITTHSSQYLYLQTFTENGLTYK